MNAEVIDSAFADLRQALLDGIQGGEYHKRSKATGANKLEFNNYSSIGQLLKACAVREGLAEALLDRLAPHRGLIVNVLPAGIQPHGLIPDDYNEPKSDQDLRQALDRLTDEEIRQWIVDDAGLIYGELQKTELDNYFSELPDLLSDREEFIDLGSGLGKVVMTAAISCQFESYQGIELVPYRHRLALERFNKFNSDLQAALDTFPGGASGIGSWGNKATVEYDKLREISDRVSFRLGDMFATDFSRASLIFMYSTCFGSQMDKIASKLADGAPEGCLVSTTTYALHHPGLQLIKHFPAKTLAWTDVRFYERVGKGPWPKCDVSPPAEKALEVWKKSARDLLNGGGMA